MKRCCSSLQAQSEGTDTLLKLLLYETGERNPSVGKNIAGSIDFSCQTFNHSLQGMAGFFIPWG
jgi:hypothetical protein